jgi:glycosyltransferase involved in cell wall biosynthesis
MTQAVSWPLVSIVVPARNEAELIARVVQAISRQASRALEIEIIVVDDGSTDDTVAVARAAGARVIEARGAGERGNCAAARNRGAADTRGDPIVFVDADCVVANDWLEHLLRAHERGATIVGGSLALPPGLPATARCDYYCGWYLIHPNARAGWVPHHPPPNLSVRRAAFLSTAGYMTEAPYDFANEERFWQGELVAAGHRIYFEPKAIADHYNHAGFRNLLRRNYRWGYTAVEVKSQTGVARAAWLYRYPWLVIVFSPLLGAAHTLFILICWARAGIFEPVLMLPAVLVSRLAYVSGMVVGALRWLRVKKNPGGTARHRPRWG